MCDVFPGPNLKCLSLGGSAPCLCLLISFSKTQRVEAKALSLMTQPEEVYMKRYEFPVKRWEEGSKKEVWMQTEAVGYMAGFLLGVLEAFSGVGCQFQTTKGN